MDVRSKKILDGHILQKMQVGLIEDKNEEDLKFS